MPETDALLRDLTEPQREAVLQTEGPVLVLAAAGSGKTRVITRRIAHLIRCGIPPWSILALTFTNKAAGEMRRRVDDLLASEASPSRGLTISTFHSLCARLLRRHAQELRVPGLSTDFAIYDTADQTELMKRVLGELNLSTTNWPPRAVLEAISKAKNDALDAASYAAKAADFYTRSVAKVYTAYEAALRAANALDFDDLLLLTARGLRSCPTMRQACNARWQYLLVDEYQDTNRAQFMIASMLLADATQSTQPNIFVVGDPDQSIYGWRGADISIILEFEQSYPGARVIALGENFRSTAPILAAADALIRHNIKRKHKPLFTKRAGGDPVRVALCMDEHHEAQVVADWLRAQASKHELAWRDMGIFYRNNSLSRVLEDALRSASIPYTIARGTSFYQREEVKTALAYLRTLANPADDVSFLRIVNTPTRGIGAAALEAIQTHAGARRIPLASAIAEADRIPGLAARARNSAQSLARQLDDWGGRGSVLAPAADQSLRELVERVVVESGLFQMYNAQAQASKSETDAERTANLNELVSSAAEFEEAYDPSSDPAVAAGPGAPPRLTLLRAFLESVSLVADADAVDPDRGSVTLMTLHAAKGLEYPAVAIVGLEEGTLPSSRSLDSPDALEEERRLFFVGITRAMRRLCITNAAMRTFRGIPQRTIPSRFLDELPREHVEMEDLADIGSATSPPGADSVLVQARGATRAIRFTVGSRVRHQQFGVGTVKEVHDGSSPRAVVDFLDVGKKTLVLEYARLEPIS